MRSIHLRLPAVQSRWYRQRGSYCFSSGLTGGKFFQFSNFPENACTNALRNAFPMVAKMSGCGCSKVPENGTFVPNRSFG